MMKRGFWIRCKVHIEATLRIRKRESKFQVDNFFWEDSYMLSYSMLSNSVLSFNKVLKTFHMIGLLWNCAPKMGKIAWGTPGKKTWKIKCGQTWAFDQDGLWASFLLYNKWFFYKKLIIMVVISKPSALTYAPSKKNLNKM